MGEFMNPKALVTGATGYIGTKLCQRLLADGWQVDVLVRETGRPLAQTLVSKVTVHSYDGSTQSVMDAVAAAKPTVVFHLASLFIAEHRSEQVADLINSNLLFGTQLVEACARTGVKRFVNTGTAWQHYNNEDYNPVCLYAATKQAFEALLEYYVQACDIKVITLKLFDTYGPEDPRPKLFNFLEKASASGVALNMSKGEQLIDLVHIDDVITAFMIAAHRLLRGKVVQHERYAVSSGQPLALRMLVKIYIEVTKKNVQVNWNNRPYRDREVMVTWNKNTSLPDWIPNLDLSAGLLSLLQKA